MIGGVTRRMLPNLSGVPHLHVNRPYDSFSAPQKAILYCVKIA